MDAGPTSSAIGSQLQGLRSSTSRIPSFTSSSAGLTPRSRIPSACVASPTSSSDAGSLASPLPAKATLSLPNANSHQPTDSPPYVLRHSISVNSPQEAHNGSAVGPGCPPISGASPTSRYLGQSLQSLTTSTPSSARRPHSYAIALPIASHPVSAGSSRPPTPPSRTNTPNMFSSNACPHPHIGSILALPVGNGLDASHLCPSSLSQPAGNLSTWQAVPSPRGINGIRDSSAQMLDLQGNYARQDPHDDIAQRIPLPSHLATPGAGSKSSIQVSVRMRPLG